MNDTLLLALLVFLAATLYSSVGHGGASAYLAAMALLGVAPAEMKPTALALNILVAGLGTYRYVRAGRFRWAVFWPFAIAAVPMAFLGGYLRLGDKLYMALVGVALLVAAARLAQTAARVVRADDVRTPSKAAALGVGAGIGLLSGATGTGGGIFLTPLLMLFKWCDTRAALGVSAAFVLVNSVAGLAGNILSVRDIPASIAWLAPAALLGGVIGTEMGARRLTPRALRYLLALVLVIAGMKLLLA